MIKFGDVIQVNENVENWSGCIMLVEEVSDSGVIAGLKIPYQGTTYLRLKHEQYEYIGTAPLTPCLPNKLDEEE